MRAHETERRHALEVRVVGPDFPDLICRDPRDEEVRESETLSRIAGVTHPSVESIPRSLDGEEDR